MTASPDTHAIHELILYADNTERLYQYKLNYIKSVQRRIRLGTYDPVKAERLWRYWLDEADRLYRREFGCSTAVFPPAVRNAAAAEVAEREYDAISNGDYDEKG